MLSLMSKGKSKGMSDQFHPWKTSLTFRLVDSRGIGSWMMDLKGPKSNQLSNQKSKLLSCPEIHFIPSLNTCSPFFKPFQIGDPGNLASFLEFRCCMVPYFSLSTLTQGALSSEWNLQLSLAKSAVFLPLAYWSPKPPLSFGVVTLSQPTQCIFLEFSMDPHRKFLFTLFMPFRILFESWTFCIA